MHNHEFLNIMLKNFEERNFLFVGKILEPIKKFFREDMGKIVSAYFDGEKIYIARLTEKFETVEVEADGSEIEQLAAKISQVCRQKGWETSRVGFCLREGDAVTYQSETTGLSEEKFPEYVKSWAQAQAGAEAKFSFTKVGEELWMESMPKTAAEEYFSAFKKFGLNLRGLSAMPADMLTKLHPYDRTEFITEVIQNKTAPNFLTQGSAWNWKRIFKTIAAIFIIGLMIISAKLFLDYNAAADKLDAAKVSVENLSEDIALKQTLDEHVAELHRLNKLAAQVGDNKNFNLLLNLGKSSSREVRLTKIRVEKDLLELEGVTGDSAALKSYLGLVRNFVAPSARLESSKENDDGDIVFVIRASLK